MEKKQILNSPFACKQDAYPGQKDFDKTYKSITIVDVVEKTGEGDQDFILKKKVIVNESLIEDVVSADADSVGVANIIKQVLRTGDTSLLPIDRGSGELVDLVGAPENLMEVKKMGEDAQKKFEALPDELKKGMDMVSFVNSMTQEKFDEFIKAISDRANNQEKGNEEHE